MLERWPLPTLLLGTLTAWALLLALAAALGLGGRVSPHPPDAALAPPLPEPQEAAGATAALALPPLSAFADVTERPLFSPDRRPQAVRLGGPAEDTGAGDLVLTSVVLTPDLRLALFQTGDGDQTLRAREGEPLPGRPSWRLLELGPRHAVLDGPEGQRQLALRVFDGRGGEAPTRLRPPERAAAAAETPTAPQAAAEPAAVTPDSRTSDALERARQIRERIEARRAELREQAARRQEAQEE